MSMELVLIEQRDKAREEVKQLSRELDNERAEMGRIRAQRDEALAEVERLKVELQRESARYQAAINGLEHTSNQRDDARRQRDEILADRDNVRQELDEARAEENGLITERDQAQSEIELLKRDIARLFQEKWESIKERDEARAEVERLNRELEQAIAERAPHDYGILAEQRDQYKQLHFGAIQKLDKARAELAQLKAERDLSQQVNCDEALAEVEKLRAQLQQWKQNSRQHYEAYLQAEEALTANQKLTVRPEPSRLEIAAMFKAAWLSNTDYQFEDACDDGWWIEQADALIEAAKGGVE